MSAVIAGWGWKCKFVNSVITVIHGALEKTPHSGTILKKFDPFKNYMNRSKIIIPTGMDWGWTRSRLMLDPDAVGVDLLAVNLLASSRSICLGSELGSRKTTARITPWTWSSGHDPVRIRWGLPRPFGRNSKCCRSNKNKKLELFFAC